MKISILMCAYNAEAYIDKAIQSVLDQTYANWELLISNDCSKDNTEGTVQKYLADERIQIFNQPVNLGIIRNKNWLFSRATGDFITQLDADDFYSINKLERQIEIFRQHPDINVCATNTLFVGSDDELKGSNNYPEDLVYKEMFDDYPFMFAGLMIRSEILPSAGQFSEYFIGVPGDDHHWTIRLNQKYAIYFIKDPLYSYRIHSSSFTNTLDANPRKLIAADIIDELYRQRKETGSDYLETGEWDKMLAFEQSVLNNPVIMGEKYRIAAAKETDKKNWELAGKLLTKSFKLNKYNSDLYRTLVYYWRSKLFRGARASSIIPI